jgi:opacity protein-like surface antigen
MIKKVITALFVILSLSNTKAQDSSLLELVVDNINAPTSQVVSGTFKATQIVNTPTVESPAKKALQFMIMHRFGRLNEGAYALFGLDNAGIRFAFDYGITDKLAIGVGRSSFEKVYDASFKWKVVRQKQNGVPVSVSAYGMIANSVQKYSDKPYLNAKYRTIYTSQLLIARKVNSKLSLQLTPSWVHFNLVPSPADKNDVFALGVGGRMKLTNRVSINAEYNYLPDGQVVSSDVFSSLSMGVDIETGGHVFQLIFTNSEGMNSPYYLTKTRGRWEKGDIYFGFNVTRIFNLKK